MMNTPRKTQGAATPLASNQLMNGFNTAQILGKFFPGATKTL
jgi:hypothetical protein